MRIAVNTRFLLNRKMEGFGWYTYEIVKRLVEYHPEHEFIFFFDRPFDQKFVFGANVEPVVLTPQARHPILHYIWFEYSVRRALKKYKADIFLSPDGYLSLKTAIPQIAVIHDINFEHNPKDLPWLDGRYYRYFFPRFAKKATQVITVSEYSKQDIVSSYGIDPNKVTAIWNGASDHFKVLEQEEKVKTRQKYAKGYPYFLFVGALHPRKNVARLVRAFIEFKKESTNDIKLLIVGTELWSNALKNLDIPDAFKSDIFFTGHLQIDELAKVMGSAMALTFVPYFEGFGIPLVEAMKCGTPIIAGNKTSLPEVAGDAAIYCDPYEVDQIKAKMLELTSSEELRNKLSTNGIKRSELFSWDKSASQVWQVLCSVPLNKNL